MTEVTSISIAHKETIKSENNAKKRSREDEEEKCPIVMLPDNAKSSKSAPAETRPDGSDEEKFI